MTKVESGRPGTNEYAEYYAKYTGRIPGTDIVPVLEQQLESTLAVLRKIDEHKAEFRYEPGKWSIKQLLGHVIDTERVFAYRAMVFSRNDTTALPGFDQDKWAEQTDYSGVTMADLTAEFEAVRRATIALFRNVEPAAWTRRGTANGKEVSVRGLAFISAGHVDHHIEILKSRYLK
jgi:DinB family protein